MSEPIYYLNGKFVPKCKALISVHDLGWVRGYGVFDFIVTYGGKPFMLQKHLTRLRNSAKLIGLKIPWTQILLSKLTTETLNKNNNGKEKSIRIVITGGVSDDSTTLPDKPTIAIIVNDKHSYQSTYYKNGVKVITFEPERVNPQAKSLNYTQGISALVTAHKIGAIEAVYINKHADRIYEGVTSNIFLVKNGKVFTPDGDTLVGITRELVRNIVAKKYSVTIREVKISELFGADEVFLSASNKEIMPVVRVDNKKIGKGVPGPITKNIMQEYRAFIDSGKW